MTTRPQFSKDQVDFALAAMRANAARPARTYNPQADEDNDQAAWLSAWDAAQKAKAKRRLPDGWRWLLLVVTVSCVLAVWATWLWATV